MYKEIIVRGARQHNLKNVDVDLPRNQLIVVTGLSGSGKSSLAFDTIFGEGQRRYVESLSAYARQFLQMMEKPDVDSIEGLSPAISIEQKTITRNPRSTVATVTEVQDYLRLLYSRIGIPFCPRCDLPIQSQTTDQIVEQIIAEEGNAEIQLLAPIIRERKGEYRKELEDFLKKGFSRARIDGSMTFLDQPIKLERHKFHTIELVVDRFPLRDVQRERIRNSVEYALKLGKGDIVVLSGTKEKLFSINRACARCGFNFPEIEPRFFSFNSPIGACPECDGIGEVGSATRVYRMAEKKAEEILITSAASARELYYSPSKEALDQWQVAEDDLEEEESRVCPVCDGTRLREEALYVRIGNRNIAEVMNLSVTDADALFESWRFGEQESLIATPILREMREKLSFLKRVGLDYVSLDRKIATLSSGEAQRVRLASQIGAKLRGILYVLDEPTIGLHPRDNRRLIDALITMKDLGNTVIVVEHDEQTIRSADYVVDLGPGAGKNGGVVVAAGKLPAVLKNDESLTAAYLTGRKKIEVPPFRRKSQRGQLEVIGATEHNLKNINAKFPIGLLTVVTGVSGSGKSTLVLDILYKAVSKILYKSKAIPGQHLKIEGVDQIDKIINIDQAPIGRTPRSNPATYVGLFNYIRDFFAQLPESRIRGYTPGRFSFNVTDGRCAECRGYGETRIIMHFMPDVFVRCDVCAGKRYNQQTLEVNYEGKNIADVLDMTISEAAEFFQYHPQMKARLDVLEQVGLGYIHLGQPATTLSGGEAQRIKLAKELCKRGTGKTLYILDEPTTGLHFEDVHHLLKILVRLVESGNTVIVIEHNMEIIKCADYILDLGPEGGVNGGKIVASGTPEHIARSPKSITGAFLAQTLS
ncbi:excinuclease ABC subunit UvrA [bacterium]|nr:excinuclease ABC subunit UvrA [bacterium]MCI0612787.1 excinuclease ABC subunit UvrA [bacterium]